MIMQQLLLFEHLPQTIVMKLQDITRRKSLPRALRLEEYKPTNSPKIVLIP